VIELKNRYGKMLRKRCKVLVAFKEDDDMDFVNAYMSITNEAMYISFVDDACMLQATVSILPEEIASVTETSSYVYFDTEFITIMYAL